MRSLINGGGAIVDHVHAKGGDLHFMRKTTGIYAVDEDNSQINKPGGKEY